MHFRSARKKLDDASQMSGIVQTDQPFFSGACKYNRSCLLLSNRNNNNEDSSSNSSDDSESRTDQTQATNHRNYGNRVDGKTSFVIKRNSKQSQFIKARYCSSKCQRARGPVLLCSSKRRGYITSYNLEACLSRNDYMV